MNTTNESFLDQIEWKVLPFESLDIHQLYAALRLRNDVFVVEQNCMYADLDGKDQASWHILGYDNQHLVAYARLIPAGISYPETSIGRVVTHPDYRKHRLGTALMRQSISWIQNKWPQQPIKISAQYHLKNFYETFGFEQVSEPYDDAGIPHIAMRLAGQMVRSI
jgi:ElaA protein